MNNETIQLLLVTIPPFITLIVCWISLMVAMHKTTGELKYWLTPENTIKGVSIIFVITSVLELAVLKILGGDVVATLLSGIIGYTLGTKFLEK